MQTFNKLGIIYMRSIFFLRDWYMFSIKNLKQAYTLAEVIVVMLIIAVVVAISIKIAKAKFDHITSYTYYSAFSVVRNVTAEMLNDFNAEDETYTSHEGLFAKLFMNKAYGNPSCLLEEDASGMGLTGYYYCYKFKTATAASILGYFTDYNSRNYGDTINGKINMIRDYQLCNPGSSNYYLDCYEYVNMSINELSKLAFHGDRLGEIVSVYASDELGLLDIDINFSSNATVMASLPYFKERYGGTIVCAWDNGTYDCLDDWYQAQYNAGSCFGFGTHWGPTNTMCDINYFTYAFFYKELIKKDTEPGCTPKPCIGGNEFDSDPNVCDCVCRKSPPNPVPCGKEWSVEQCQLVDKADFPPTCPPGQVFDKSDEVCGCKPIKPSIPIKGANYCKLFVSYSNTAQLPTECNGSKVSAVTSIFGGEDANVSPDLILRNGMVIYNASQNPTRIAELEGNSRGNIYTDADGNEFDLDEWGYTLYIDIDGQRGGNGVLWEDVYPFYVTLSGMTIPAYNKDNIDLYGGGNKAYLQVSLLDEYTNNTGRHTDWLLKSKSFRESACQSGYVSANSTYCKTSPAYTTLAQCNQEGHDCRLKYVSPYSLFKK